MQKCSNLTAILLLESTSCYLSIIAVCFMGKRGNGGVSTNRCCLCDTGNRGKRLSIAFKGLSLSVKIVLLLGIVLLLTAMVTRGGWMKSGGENVRPP